MKKPSYEPTRCVVCRCRNECRAAMRRHRRGCRVQRRRAMVVSAVVVFLSVQESRWTVAASGMGMCPCTLAGRRGDSGIGELVLGTRQSSVLPATGIYIETTRRARGAVYGRGRADRSDRWDGRVVGSDRAGVWVTSGPVRRLGSARFVFILYF